MQLQFFYFWIGRRAWIRLPSAPFVHQLPFRNRPSVTIHTTSTFWLIPEMPRVHGPICSALWCNCSVQGLQMWLVRDYICVCVWNETPLSESEPCVYKRKGWNAEALLRHQVQSLGFLRFGFSSLRYIMFTTRFAWNVPRCSPVAYYSTSSHEWISSHLVASFWVLYIF